MFYLKPLSPQEFQIQVDATLQGEPIDEVVDNTVHNFQSVDEMERFDAIIQGGNGADADANDNEGYMSY